MDKMSLLTLSENTKPTGVKWLDAMVKEDKTRLYYPFLYHLAQEMKPSRIVELGVQTGRSTAHLALGAPEATVYAVDPDKWDLTDIFDHCSNIVFFEEYSQDFNTDYLTGGIDILFIDSDHTYEQVMTEWTKFSPFVQKDGVVLLDDIHYSEDMEKAWNELPGEKLDISHLHPAGKPYAGFGAIII